MILRIDGDGLIWRAGKGAESQDDAPPVEHCLHNIKTIIATYVTTVVGKLNLDLGDVSVRLYLSPRDKTNFRFYLSDAVRYKENRLNIQKPIHFDAMYEYMVKHYPTSISHGQEADDEMSIDQMKDLDNSIIISRDKDLRMVPGWHWDTVTTHDIYFVEGLGELRMENSKLWGTGLKWFYAQLMMGDAVDNIPGLKGIGPAKAFKFLDPLGSEEEMLLAVVEKYKDQGHNYDYFLTNARMLWMRRTEYEMWEPKLDVEWD